MRKISLINLKNALSREQMRVINGGINNPNLKECKSDCEIGGVNTCATTDCPKSYCATIFCGPSNVRIYSCQYQ